MELKSKINEAVRGDGQALRFKERGQGSEFMALLVKQKSRGDSR